MASFLARRALSISARRTFSTSARRMNMDKALKEEQKQNPEIFILGAVMLAGLGGAGYYFGRSPTQATSEEDVSKAGMAWETSTDGKYRYFPGGDEDAEPKDAPSAVNVVVVPNVNLPKSLHDKYNKWGKDGF